MVANLQGMKEEDTKYSVRKYHNGKLWLDQPHSISSMTIHLIIKLYYKRPKVPTMVDVSHWLKELVGGASRKNSRDHVISQV